jgi:hypothetical protein
MRRGGRSVVGIVLITAGLARMLGGGPGAGRRSRPGGDQHPDAGRHDGGRGTDPHQGADA